MNTKEHTHSAADLGRIDHQSQVAAVRRAVLIGLSAYGELERLHNQADIAATCGQPMPEAWQAVHVSADPAEISNFADALRFLDQLDKAPL